MMNAPCMAERLPWMDAKRFAGRKSDRNPAHQSVFHFLRRVQCRLGFSKSYSHMASTCRFIDMRVDRMPDDLVAVMVPKNAADVKQWR